MAAKAKPQLLYCIKHPSNATLFWTGAHWDVFDLAKPYANPIDAQADALVCGGTVLLMF